MNEGYGEVLLAVARHAIATRLGAQGTNHAMHSWLHESGATFVTLTQKGDLRGCVGSLLPHRSLVEDVSANAIAAATRDPRFPALRAPELPGTRIEVSLLSESTDMVFDSEMNALAQLQPGIDGVVLQYGRAQGTFLPQVWESLPQAEEFLAHLKRKAGLPADFWHEDIRLSRYSVTKWKEADEA